MIMGALKRHYSELSFSGGGLRCFWQGGALHSLAEVQPVKPERVSAASGGALTAASIIAGRGDELLDIFSRHIEQQDDNVDWNAAIEGGDLTPHQRLYSDVVHELLDEKARKKIVDGPTFEIILAHPPDALPLKLSAGMSLVAYEIDKAVRSTPHTRFPKMLGVREIRVDARKAAEEGDLADLICLAATIPPIFTVQTWNGDPVIDSGTVDNAPLPLEGVGDTLVLLTRSYRNLPDHRSRTYVFPSEATPVDKIDFTDALGLRACYEQGKADLKQLIACRDEAES